MNDHLLWVDLETTGVDEAKDCIIEVGAILTTSDLEVIDEYADLVLPTDEGFGRMMMNNVVRGMHEQNGLLAALLAVPRSSLRHSGYVGDQMCEWMKGWGATSGKVVIAGSGVSHFDRRFIRRQMPKLDAFCRHWHIDIGVVRRAHAMWVGTEVPNARTAEFGKTHRALDDIRCHLNEARAFRSHWQAT